MNVFWFPMQVLQKLQNLIQNKNKNNNLISICLELSFCNRSARTQILILIKMETRVSLIMIWTILFVVIMTLICSKPMSIAVLASQMFLNKFLTILIFKCQQQNVLESFCTKKQTNSRDQGKLNGSLLQVLLIHASKIVKNQTKT